MKRVESVERLICDVCETNGAYESDACLRCGKAFCYECQKTHAREYKHGVHFSGSGDGTYCLPCDALLRKEGTDPLHRAYLLVDALRMEEAGFYQSFKERAAKAEKDVERLRKR